MKRKEKVAIFIPAYNVAHTLPLVIDRIPKEIKDVVKEIFIIDNDSQDSTYLVGVQYKKRKGMSNLTVLKNKRNLGYGGTQKVAYQYAIDRGYDYVVMLHGDAQYAPEKIPTLLDAIKSDKSDMVFGSRMEGNPRRGGMPVFKLIGNKFLTGIENFVLKLKLSEYHSGFRVYRCAALNQVPFKKCSDAYEFDTDILIQFKIKGLKITERPIPTHYGKESRHPSFSELVGYSANILKALMVYMLHVRGIREVEKFRVS